MTCKTEALNIYSFHNRTTSSAQYLKRTGLSLRQRTAIFKSSLTAGLSVSPSLLHSAWTHLYEERRDKTKGNYANKPRNWTNLPNLNVQEKKRRVKKKWTTIQLDTEIHRLPKIQGTEYKNEERAFISCCSFKFVSLFSKNNEIGPVDWALG